MPKIQLLLCAATVAASSGVLPKAVSTPTTPPYPVPSAMPPRGWNTVGEQVFIHGCKADGLFNATELAVATKFPLMTVEKGQGLRLPGFADGKMAAIAAQYKQSRKQAGLADGWALFYSNVKLDWEFFQLHAQMEVHPSWPVQANGAVSGDPCRSAGDHSFPQPPEGMLCFNHSKPTVREAFINACVNATHHGFDGCFLDSAGFARGPPYPGTTVDSQRAAAKHCNTSLEAYQAVGEGTTTMLAELQETLGPSKLVVAKDSWQGGSEDQVNTIFPLDTFCSCYTCDWTPTNNPAFRGSTLADVCQTQILLAQRLGERGQVCLCMCDRASVRQMQHWPTHD